MDQEVCSLAGDLFPTSFDWTNADVYLQHQEDFAREVTKSGGTVSYVFIDPLEYVDWCREVNVPVDSQASRAAFAGVMSADGDAIPYSPEQPLWPMGVTAMVIRSELGGLLSPDPMDSQQSHFIDQYTDLIVAVNGRYRSIVTASRYAVHDEDELWQHFAAAVTSQTTLTFCDDYLSVMDHVENRNEKLTLSNYGNHNPWEAVLSLARVGHGIVGIEHRHNADFTFRAFDITPAGITPVDVETLGRRLRTPGAPSLRSGWE
ncbi:MAG: hypothetical protein ACYDEP_02340 [Acidimicrobiales bacterium]